MAGALSGAMPIAAATRSVPPRRRRARWALVLVALVLAPLILLLLAVETAPRVVDPGPPDAAAAARTRDVVTGLKALVDTEAASGAWSVSEADLNAVLASAQRLTPGVFGRARVDAAAVSVEVSARAPLLPHGLWVNLQLALAPSESGLEVASARIGRIPLPPWLAVRGLTLMLDRALGGGLGGEAIAGVAALRLAPPEVTVAFSFDPEQRDAFFDGLRARVLAAAGTTARTRVYDQLAHLHRGARRGRLPREGSVLPYLTEAARFAAEPSEGEDREEFRAALYALALYCGDPDFGRSIAVQMSGRMQGAANGCDGTRLDGRDDLKRHFVISAGLYAATTGKAAFGMGELKELLDSNSGGSGFSFDDMAADLAGAQFAEAFLDAPRSEWPALLARIGSEADIMPSIEGLPSGLSEAEFRARFGDVDSPAYAAMVDEIKRRVSALPLAAPSAGGVRLTCRWRRARPGTRRSRPPGPR